MMKLKCWFVAAFVLLLVLECACPAHAELSAEEFGIKPGLLPIAKCTACERVMTKMAGHLSGLILAGKKWTKKRKKDVWDKIKMVCGDEELFPRKGDDVFTKACAYLMVEHHKQILASVRRRLSPRFEEYEEDIVPKAFCREVGACDDSTKSVEDVINQSERKRRLSEL